MRRRATPTAAAPSSRPRRAASASTAATRDGQGDPATLTGSGPARWRHDHTAHGIADLCGNLWEWQAGLRLVDGKSRSFQTTTPCRPTCLGIRRLAGVEAVGWRAGGAGHPDSAKFDACRECREGNAGAPMLRSRILHRNGPAGDNANHPALMDAPFGQIECDGGGGAPALLRALGLAPIGPSAGRAQAYLRNYGERIFMAGGAWYSGHDAGLEALCLSHPRGHASATVGARPPSFRHSAVRAGPRTRGSARLGRGLEALGAAAPGASSMRMQLSATACAKAAQSAGRAAMMSSVAPCTPE